MSVKQTAVFLAALLLGVVGASASADDTSFFDLSLEELANVKISAASRHEQDISTAPAVVSVVTRQDIDRYGADNLFDLLAHFPGFLPLSNPTTGRGGLSLRGDGALTSERILTLIDGKPYRSNASEGLVVNELYQNFPLIAIERVELIRGPGSSMYGGTAVTGIVNIVTRKATEKGGDISASVGNRDTNQTMFFVGNKNESTDQDWQVSLSGNTYDTNGWQVEGTNGAVPFTYKYPGNGQSLMLDASLNNFYFKTLWTDMTANYPQPTRGDVKDMLETQQVYYDAGYSGEISATTNWDAHYSHLDIDDGNLRIGNIEDLFESNLFVDFTSRAKLQSGVSLNRSKTFSYGQTVSGISNHPDMSGGVYTQVDYQLTDMLSTYVGAQWSKTEDSQGRLSPRLGIVYKMNDMDGVKLLYNEAFRSPTAVEADMNITLNGLGLAFVDNPNLSPETVKTWDMQWFHYGKKFEYTVTAFHSHYEDHIQNQDVVINYVPFPVLVKPGQFVQNNDLRVYGLEWEGKAHLSESDDIISNAVWQHNQDRNEAVDSTLMPAWTMTLGYTHTFNNRWVYSVLNQHFSTFYDNGNEVNKYNPQSSSVDLLSSQLTIPLPHLLHGEVAPQLFIRAENLLDECIWQPELATNNYNTIPVEDGRRISVGIKMHW